MINRVIGKMWPTLRSWIAYGALPAIGIITAPLIAHMLGAVGRGQLAGVLQPLTLASAVACLGIPSAVTYYIGKSYSHTNVVRMALALASAAILITTIFMIYYSGSLSEKLNLPRLGVLSVWATLIPTALISIRRGHVLGSRLYLYLDIERIVIAGSRIIALLCLWMLNVRDVIIYAFAYVTPGLIAALALRKTSGRTTTSPRSIDIPNFRDFARYSVLASFGTIATAMGARLDQALMPQIVSPGELGNYSVAVTVAEVCSIITMVSSRNVLAEASASAEKSKIVFTFFWGLIAQISLIVFLWVISPFAVPRIFGLDFIPSIDIIGILLIGSLFSYVANVQASYLTGAGRPGLSSAGQMIAAIVTVALFWESWNQMSAAKAAWINLWAQGFAVFGLFIIIMSIAFKKNEKIVEVDPRLARMPKPIIIFDPSRIWQLSSQLHHKGFKKIARLLKAYNFIMFRAVLPPEAHLASIPSLGHWAMNIVVHPNVSLGNKVMIWHGVTLSVSDSPGAPSRIIIGDNVSIGAGAVVITPHHESLHICDNVKIGANAVVTHSIDMPGTYVGAPARLV